MAARGAIVRPVTQTKYYPFNGGLDVVTPALSIDPGFALSMINYEPYYNGGYRRIDGYERTDGRAKPSAAVFYGAPISSFSGLTVGTSTGTSTGVSCTGSVSGATAQFIWGLQVLGTGWVGLTNVSGTFTAGDKLVVGTATSTGTLTVSPSLNFGPAGTGTDNYLYTSEMLASAQNYYRQQIQPVPGTGNILGAWQNGTNVYAIRGTGTVGTPANIYLQSAAGWTKTGITFVNTMYFQGLGTQGLPANGSVVTGATSGATGTLYAGITHTTVAGYVALTGIAGTFGTAEGLKAGGTTFGTSASAATQFSLPTNGFYRFKNFNFFATPSTYSTYAVNGKGPAFQIDQNNVICPILMPLNPLTNQPPNNTPFLVEEYQNYLVLGFPGGIYQLSVIGQPLQYNGFLGAAQFSTGAELTGLFNVVGPNLIMATKQNMQSLIGNTSANFQQQLIAEKVGAILYSGQLLDTVYSIGNLGITSLSRTQSYGNFVGSTISQLIQPIITALRPNFNDATIVRAFNEARFYFNDGSCLIMYVPGLGQQNKAWSAIESGVTAQFGYASYPSPVFCAYNSEDQNNAEVGFFGFSNGDGFVYQDRSGTSFDGNAVTAYTRLAFNNVGSPATRKYFRRADLELNATSQISLKFAADLSYSNGESSSAVATLTAKDVPVLNVFGGGGYWDSINWNQFEWDGQAISTARAQLSGTGENVSFLIFHQSVTDSPFVLQGLTLHYDPRRLQR